MLLRTVLPAITLTLAFTPGGNATELACPDAILETPSAATTQGPWRLAAAAGERPLDHAGIYLGAPGQLEAQVPDFTRKKQHTETVTWRLKRADGDRYWIGCSYVGTTAMMVRPVEPGIQECEATYELLRTGRRQRLKGMACR